MADALLPDELWSFIETQLPVYRPSPKGGRPRIGNRAALTLWSASARLKAAHSARGRNPCRARVARSSSQTPCETTCGSRLRVTGTSRLAASARYHGAYRARYGIESRERLGRWRWVVERTLGWLHRFRRLRIRYERRADIHQAFLALACSLICWRYVERFC
jgi:transposase